MPIEQCRAEAVSARILPTLYEVAAGHDLGTYPVEPLLTFRARFSTLRVDRGCLAEAMRWRWGRWNSIEALTATESALVAELDAAWAAFVDSGTAAEPAPTFDWWAARRDTRADFFTIAWLTHLVHHRCGWPLVGRHAFRAMHQLLHETRGHGAPPPSVPAPEPSTRADVERLSTFVQALLERMPGVERDTLCRFLAVYGRERVPRPAAPADGTRRAD